MIFDLIAINNTPVLAVGTQKPEYGRILGATMHKERGFWMFPAYLPFLPKVLSDISVVDSAPVFSEKAQNYLENLRKYPEWREIIQDHVFPTQSRDHQRDGVAELLTYPRWMLQWGMGVGKTKIAIDTINYLKVPALVLCPKVALKNWLREIEKHGGGVRAMIIDGASRQKKLCSLAQMPQYEIVIATYDTARMYGAPTLSDAATEALVRAHRAPPLQLRHALLALNDPAAQTRIVQEWLTGRSPATAIEELTALRGGQIQWLMDWNYQMLICDESHRIKNISSSRTAAVLQMSAKAARRVLLSGTPIQGNPKDAFPQMKFLAPYIISGDYRAFCKKYVVYAPNNDKVVVGYKNLHVLNRILGSVSSKRELADCVDLPPQTFIKVPYALDGEQVTAYDAAVRDWVILRENEPDMPIVHAASCISKLLQICSGFVYLKEHCKECDTCPQLNTCVVENIQPGTARCIKKDLIAKIPRKTQWYAKNPKLDALEDLLEDLVPADKVIIWAAFTAELDILEKSLRKKKLGYVRVDGSTMSHCQESADRFNTDPTCHVYLAHISTGIAITLNAARYALYYSRDWSMENRKQSLARNYRIGQTQKTVVYDFCAENTVEEQQLAALDSKENISLLLTKKVDCLTCSQYSLCVTKEIAPWDDGCVYKKSVARVIAKATPLEDAEEYDENNAGYE